MSRGDVTRSDALEAVRTILRYIGEDPDREGLLDTPDRVVRSWNKLYGGYGGSASEILRRSFASDGYDQMISLGPIEFYSTCEHHMLPFFGYVTVGYVPGASGRVVGVSKLARLVELFSRRLQIQERMTDQIASALESELAPAGVGVLVRAQHFCMTSRGVEKRAPAMTTAAMRGVMLTDTRARAEFYAIAEVHP